MNRHAGVRFRDRWEASVWARYAAHVAGGLARRGTDGDMRLGQALHEADAFLGALRERLADSDREAAVARAQSRAQKHPCATCGHPKSEHMFGAQSACVHGDDASWCDCPMYRPAPTDEAAADGETAPPPEAPESGPLPVESGEPVGVAS